MMEEIVHSGKILEVTPEFTSVEIVSESACSACHAKGLCGVSESKSKIIQVPTRGWDNWKAGDDVKVCLKASMGHKAVWLAYVIPLVVLLTVLLALLGIGIKDIISAGAAFTVLALYYFILWLFRGRLRNEYIFNIKQ